MWLPVEILRMILACFAPDHLHTVAAVCHDWANITKDRRESIAKLRLAPFNIKNPLTCAHMRVSASSDRGEHEEAMMMVALKAAICSGALASLESLSFCDWNFGIGDDGVKALATAFASGALPSLETLDIGYNNIGDAGASALATAVGNGALAHLVSLSLYGNQIGNEGVMALASACAIGALPLLEMLSLSDNKIGGPGCIAFGNAVGKGALASLKELRLDDNRIGDAGVTALAAACASGSMASLKTLVIGDHGGRTDHASHSGLQPVCSACGITLKKYPWD